ncbi:MAG: CPXCG motif-containing cysteine-rich protein [Candidatus Coatesbacteria bacterium]
MTKKTPKRPSGKKPAGPPKAPPSPQERRRVEAPLPTPLPPPPALPADELAEEGEPLAEEFERFFLCPLCGARVSVLLDPSVESQTLIEDCEVCCQPLEIRYTVEEGKIAEFEVQAA